MHMKLAEGKLLCIFLARGLVRWQERPASGKGCEAARRRLRCSLAEKLHRQGLAVASEASSLPLNHSSSSSTSTSTGRQAPDDIHCSGGGVAAALQQALPGGDSGKCTLQGMEGTCMYVSRW